MWLTFTFGFDGSIMSKLCWWPWPIVFLVVCTIVFFLFAPFPVRGYWWIVDCWFCWFCELPLSRWLEDFVRTTCCFSLIMLPDLGADGIVGALLPCMILKLWWLLPVLLWLLFKSYSFLILILLLFWMLLVFPLEMLDTLLLFYCSWCIKFRMLPSESFTYWTLFWFW